MPTDSFTPIFTTIFSLVSSLLILSTFIIVIVTCIKVIKYIDYKSIGKNKLK
jgi:hypothetical protein